MGQRLQLRLFFPGGVFKRFYEESRSNTKTFDKLIFKNILSFSLYVMVLNIGIQLSYQTDALVIGSLMSVEAVTPYSIANSLTVYFMELIVAIAAVILPEASRLSSTSQFDSLKILFFKWSKISTIICFPAVIFCVLYGEAFLAWWVGPEIAQQGSIVLSVLMVSFLIFLPLRGVAQPILMGRGIVKSPTVAFLLAGIANLVFSILLVKPFGLMGVAVGTAIPNVLFALYLLFLTSKELENKSLYYLGEVFLKPAAIAAPIGIAFFFLKPIVPGTTFIQLALVGISIAVVFMSVSYILIYRQDSDLELEKLLRRGNV